jgi:hypothetical protein
MQFLAQQCSLQQQSLRSGRLIPRSLCQPTLGHHKQHQLQGSSQVQVLSHQQYAGLQQTAAAGLPASSSRPRKYLGGKHICAAAAGDSSTPVARSLSAQFEHLAAACEALYRFSRPHTMLGTFVSIVSVSIMAMQSFTWTSAAVVGLLQALVPALLMNVAIVGINQLYDVDIDKVNKPYLPLASGELSMQQGELVASNRAVLAASSVCVC